MKLILLFVLGAFAGNWVIETTKTCYYAKGMEDAREWYVDPEGHPQEIFGPLEGDVRACALIGEKI